MLTLTRLLGAPLAALTLAHASLAGEAPSPVRFTFDAPTAKTVHLAGSFNNWAGNVGGNVSGDGARMTRDERGVWVREEAIDAAVIRYKFVVEDEGGRFTWHADPRVPTRDADGNSVVFGPALRGEPGDVVCDGPRMAVHVWPATGLATVVFKDAHGRFRDALPISSVLMGGSAPTGLTRKPDARAPTYTSAHTTMTVDSASDSAVALEWAPGTPGVHDMEARIDDNARFYGGGERFNAINQKGHILWMGSSDHPEDKGTATYKPVPFVISTRGYGLWLDSTSPSTFDLNATDRHRVIIRDRAPRLRLVIIAGPSPQDVLSGFTALTGRPPVPPPWAFAPWKSRDVHKNRQDVLDDVRLHRQHDLPASVLVLDSPWETSYNDFVLNERQFPQPAEMFAEVKSLGFVTCFWLTPFINSVNVTDMVGNDPGPATNFAEASERGYLVRDARGEPLIVDWWKGRGALVDFTNPAATAWWHTQLAKTLPWGIAAIKCDDGESDFVTSARFHDGSRAEDMKGRYAQLYLKAARDFLEQHRPGDHTLISRCGFTGTGALPFGWAGDNEASWSHDNGLPGVIIAAQTAALSGQPLWGCDIAGYMGVQSPELFIRWTQFAAFTPLMMVHMQSNKGPWDFGPQALDIYRTFARLHTRLWPYLDNAAREARDHGVPIIRPMALAFPGDRAACDERFQFMFGPDFLVAPMYQPGTRRSVYLPVGNWIDYWTGASHSGPRHIEVDAPLERTPLFVRAGAIIPMLPDDIDTLLPRAEVMDPAVVALDDRRVIEAWPGGPGEMMHDGLTAAQKSQPDGHRLTITSDRARPVEVRLRLASGAPVARATGVSVERVQTGDTCAFRWSEPGTVRIDWP